MSVQWVQVISHKGATMKLKKLALAAAAGTALFAAAPAFAQYPYHYGPSYSHAPYYGYRHHRYYRPRPVVVYQPAPYYYYPPAPVYYEPRPVIYGRVPIGNHGRVGFAIGL
jgi:hypothetical protein